MNSFVPREGTSPSSAQYFFLAICRTGVLLPLPVQNVMSNHMFCDIWYLKVHVLKCESTFRYQISQNMYEHEWVLIATCKQLVWSIRIGRNMPIWFLAHCAPKLRRPPHFDITFCTGSGRRTSVLQIAKIRVFRYQISQNMYFDITFCTGSGRRTSVLQIVKILYGVVAPPVALGKRSRLRIGEEPWPNGEPLGHSVLRVEYGLLNKAPAGVPWVTFPWSRQKLDTVCTWPGAEQSTPVLQPTEGPDEDL